MPTPTDTYRTALAALLDAADHLGNTPDDIAARVLVLAEYRHAIAAGLLVDAPAVEQPRPMHGRLVWGRTARGVDYLSPFDPLAAAHYTIGPKYVRVYQGGMEVITDLRQVPSRIEGLRLAAELARADGYEVDDHPDAAT